MSNNEVGTVYHSFEVSSNLKRTHGEMIERGEFSKYDFGHSACIFVGMKASEALLSNNSLLRGLAVVDRRIGTRSLRSINVDDEHPFVQKLFHLRHLQDEMAFSQ
jgi:hypothetical protein